MTKTPKLTATEAEEITGRLVELKQEMKELMGEAQDLIRGTGMVYERARSYWLAHILTNLDDEHEWMSRETYTMQSAIDELEAIAEHADDEDEDEA